MLNLLKILLAEQRETFERVSKGFKRDIQFPKVPNKIKVAIGMRRVGKTFFLYQEIKRLIEDEKIPWERFLNLNFEDDRLLPCSQEKLRDLLESFYKLYPENHNHTCYLFLDEIQLVEDWSLVIRRFFDSKKVQIYLSGSSAKLLSKEIATELRGRSLSIEIWPYSFDEYLLATNMTFKSDLLGQQNRDILHQSLRYYLYHGGFPEIIAMPENESRQVLQDYVELVIMRDIIERYNIKNIALIKYMIKTLLKNASCSFSVNKLYNDIKSQGMSGARSVLYDYLGYLEDAYLIFSIPLFSESLRQEQSNPRKIYAIDPGLVKAYTFSLNDNFGHLFENLIFLDLKRTNHKIYYYLTKEKYEIDFFVEAPDGSRKIYQVAWDMSDPKTNEREQRALDAAKKELKVDGELITPDNYIEKIFVKLQSKG
jgi:predicted AAA+ superfamily ATPase